VKRPEEVMEILEAYDLVVDPASPLSDE